MEDKNKKLNEKKDSVQSLDEKDIKNDKNKEVVVDNAENSSNNVLTQSQDVSKKEEKMVKTKKVVKVKKDEDLDLSTNDDKPFSLMDDDDLPDDIKKKLEKKKSERSSKKGKKQIKRKKKKTRGKVEIGKVYIKATFNNTIVTITDLNGEVISWASAGLAGFRGPKKSTPYAAQIITKIATIKAKEEFNFKQASVFINGIGMGKESAIRTLNMQGIYITSIKDVTPVPHNGCRPRRPRRV